MFTWLSLAKRRWTNQQTVNQNGSARPRRRLRSRTPLLEELEQRLVPSGMNYYVNNITGSDTSLGTCQLPLRSVQGVNTFETRIHGFSAGDAINFASGQTFSGPGLSLTLSDGTPQSPIVITSYNACPTSTSPVARATIDAPDNGVGIQINNHQGFRISNINVTGYSDSTHHFNDGIQFINNRPVTLQHIYVDNVDVGPRPCVPPGCQVPPVAFGGWGIQVNATVAHGYQDVNVTYATLHHNTTGGITITGTVVGAIQNVYVGHVQAYSNPGFTGIDATGPGTGQGIYLNEVSGSANCGIGSCAIIELSVPHDNGINGTGSGGIWTSNSDHVTMQFNESYNTRDPLGGIDGHGFNFDVCTTNSIMQYNYSHNNDGPGYILTAFANKAGNDHNTIRYNISENDVRGANQSIVPGYASIGIFKGTDTPIPAPPSTSDSITYGEVYNNTIYQSPTTNGGTTHYPPALAVNATWSTHGHDVHFRNNILYTTGDAVNTSPFVFVDQPSGSVTTLLFQGSDYFTNGTFRILYNGTPFSNLPDWRNSSYHQETRTGGIQSGFNVDPMLVNAGGGGTINDADRLSSLLTAYRLQGGSPVAADGLDLTTPEFLSLNVGTRDFYGNSIPDDTGAYSIGAYGRPISH